MNFRMLWLQFRRRCASTRYTRTLEAEVARLRAENRALLNSILGIAGIPPIPVAASELKCDDPSTAAGLRTHASAAAGDATAAGVASADPHRSGNATQARARKPGGAQVTPMRRRSWQQINRMLEFESAKKRPQEVSSQP